MAALNDDGLEAVVVNKLREWGQQARGTSKLRVLLRQQHSCYWGESGRLDGGAGVVGGEIT